MKKTLLFIALATVLGLGSAFAAAPKGFTNKGETNIAPAFDGNVNTRWTSGESIKNGSYVAFDFGEPKTVTSVAFNLGDSVNDFPDKFDVLAGESLNDLSPKKFKATNSNGFVTIFFAEPVTANVIKVASLADKIEWWWSIHEATFSDAPVNSLVKAKTYTQKGETDLTGAIDGNVKTRWSSGESIRNGMFVAFDFGEPKKFSKIVVNLGDSRNDFPSRFDVLTGETLAGATDKALINTSNINGIITIEIEDPVEANVYKILSTSDNPDWWWSIHEISFE